MTQLIHGLLQTNLKAHGRQPSALKLMQIYLTGFYFFSLKLLNPFYKPTVTNKTVQKKKKKKKMFNMFKHTLKMFNTRHSTRHGQAQVMETVIIFEKVTRRLK